MLSRQDRRVLPLSTYWIMSGSDVIIWSAGWIPGTCLYFRSPMERDKFKFPFTRPNWFTRSRDMERTNARTHERTHNTTPGGKYCAKQKAPRNSALRARVVFPLRWKLPKIGPKIAKFFHDFFDREASSRWGDKHCRRKVIIQQKVLCLSKYFKVGNRTALFSVFLRHLFAYQFIVLWYCLIRRVLCAW